MVSVNAICQPSWLLDFDGDPRDPPLSATPALGRRIYGLGGPVRFHFLPGFCVGGRGVSFGSMVIRRGCGTLPPRGPTSSYSPGRSGFSPGFCVATGLFSFVGSLWNNIDVTRH